MPALARTQRLDPDTSNHPCIIDDTLIPVHDQSITAISTNYRRSVNAQTIICSHRRRVVAAGNCRPGNRNDVVVARATLAHPLTGQRHILGDGGYRPIAAITAPRPDSTGRIIRDHRYRTHRGIRSTRRTRHRPTQRLADTPALPPTRRHIKHSLQINAGLYNLKTRNQLRVNS